MADEIKDIDSSRFLQFRHSRFHYLTFGHGSKTLLAFHGFSESAESYLALEPALGEEFTIYAIDFPYHGTTEWKENRFFERQDLVDFLKIFLRKHNITSFSFFGFSMGGRMILSVLEEFASQVEIIFLVAPDGIRTHQLFNLAVYPGWGRWLFRQVMRQPGLFFFFVKLMYKNKRISKFLYEFTLNHMNTVEKRVRIFNTWMSIKNFKVDEGRVRDIANQHSFPIHLIFGKYDEVIRPKVGEEFIKGFDNATLTIVPKGHLLIKDSLNPYLVKLLFKAS